MSRVALPPDAFDQRRSKESLRLHAPYVKLLLLAVQQLMTLPAFAYEGVGYRGLKLDGNAELKRKYLDYKTEFVVGQLMTFPAFMSVSTDDSVADDFGDFVFFVFVKVRGARVARLSQLPKEAEILVPPPSVFRIKAVAKVGTTKSFVGGQEVKSGGRLTVTLEQESCPLTYLSHTASQSSAAMVVGTGGPAAAALPPPPAAASGGSVAVLPGQGEDPKILALSKALEALDVASAALCLKFAKALDEQGILTMERLKKLPEADVREALEAAGMKKLQVRTVMEAIAPPPAVAPVPPAPSPAPAPKAATAAAPISSPPAPKPAPPAFNESPSCVATLAGHGDDIYAVAFHPTAPLLATGSEDPTAKLWRLSSDNSSATCVATLAGHSSVFSVAFHPTSPLLATGSKDKTAKLWR